MANEKRQNFEPILQMIEDQMIDDDSIAKFEQIQMEMFKELGINYSIDSLKGMLNGVNCSLNMMIESGFALDYDQLQHMALMIISLRKLIRLRSSNEQSLDKLRTK